MKKLVSVFSIAFLLPWFALGQDPPVIVPDEDGKIIIETRGPRPKPPLFFSGQAESNVVVEPTRVSQLINLRLTLVQGEADILAVGLRGSGDVTKVEGKNLESWAVRRQGESRFLELTVKPSDDKKLRNFDFQITILDDDVELPATIELAHLLGGKAVGFRSNVTINYAAGLDGRIAELRGFLPIQAEKGDRLQHTSGGRISLKVARSGALAGPAELINAQLTGTVDPTGEFAEFQLRGIALVTEAQSTLTILQGNAAVSQIGQGFGYRLRLDEPTPGRPVYDLVFEGTGRFPVELDFVAPIAEANEWRSLDFSVSAGAVVPLSLLGIDPEAEFRENTSVVPVIDGTTWRGFLPANGKLVAAWKTARQTGEGKLFFTTTATVETAVGAGLLRQNHRIDYKVLQGELDTLTYELDGPGEVLAVEGKNIIGWKITGEGDDDARTIELTLSQPITGNAQVDIRTQTALDAFPVRLDPLRVTPVGTVRHSGHIRVSNQGSVRLEPAALTGVTQLSPDQFPGGAIQARQIFVYRFPSADFDYEIVADRIQPEINISQVTLYRLAETDRVITADVELDIREAPLRQFEMMVPSDYSVVSVSGSSVADYVVGTEVTNGERNLNIIFNQDVSGRQLVSLHLEKNEAAAAGEWVLPKLRFPEAKSVRGELGIVGAPGFRIGVGTTDLLVEKPLSYFPKATPNLQQAFRIREREWQGTMTVEMLDKSVQADVLHLYSLNDRTAYASVVLNYFVTGAPVSEWQLTVPAEFGNVTVDGQDVRTWRRDGDSLFVTLHQPVIGSHTLLVTYEEEMQADGGTLQPGRVAPVGVLGERGYIHVVSPVQVETVATPSENLLHLDALELPAEFRLLSSAPPLETFQYTSRPFTLDLAVTWFEPGEMVDQVVEFSEVKSRVSADGELVTDLTYFVKSRGQQALRVILPENMRLWNVSVANRSVSARQDGNATLIPLPAGTDPNVPVEVKLGLAKPAQRGKNPVLQLPTVFAPVLKTTWLIEGETGRTLVPVRGTVKPPTPVLPPRGFGWIAQHGLFAVIAIVLTTWLGIALLRKRDFRRGIGLAMIFVGVGFAFAAAYPAFQFSAAASQLELNLPVLTAGETIELEVRNATPFWASFSIFGLFLVIVGLAASMWSLIASPWQLLYRFGGAFLIALGILLQRGGAPWFFIAIGLFLLCVILLPNAWHCFQDFRIWWSEWRRDSPPRRKRGRPEPPKASTESPESQPSAPTEDPA